MIDPSGWPVEQQVDHHLVLAVSAGLEERINVVNRQLEVLLHVQPADLQLPLLVHPDDPVVVRRIDGAQLAVQLGIVEGHGGDEL